MKIPTIYAYCDSLCEPNPGQMEGGIWAKDDTDKVLFMENIPMGMGTCNQAEYYALIKLVDKLKIVMAGQKANIIIHSDSQLMTKQLRGMWKVTKSDIKLLYRKVMLTRAELPFEIKWIPRENNAIADALAQENRLKGSGRQAMMEDGRFKVKRYTPCAELLSDRQMGMILKNQLLIDQKEELEGLLELKNIDYVKVAYQIENMKVATIEMAKNIPHINNLADKWVEATTNLLLETLDDIRNLAGQKNPEVVSVYRDFFSSLEKTDSQEQNLDNAKAEQA